MAIEPTEADQVKGTLRLELGGTVRRVAVLPIRAADEWIERLQRTLDRTASSAAGVAKAGGEMNLLELARTTTHAAAELIAAYDRSGAIDREWLLDNASPEDVSDALEVLRNSALPFGRGVLSMVDVFRMTAVLEAERRESSSQLSSTNGHSPAGASPRDHLKPRSRTPRSTSSGKQARNA